MVPKQLPLDAERLHPSIVHGANTGCENCGRNWRPGTTLSTELHCPSDAGHDHRYQDRGEGQRDIVSGGQTGFVGQHGNEMG
jgi:hypothetical protein